MGSFYLILGLVFSLIIAIVALANTESVTVSYIFGRAEVSLILLILGSAFIGALVTGLFSLFRSIRSAFAFRDMRQKQEALQKQVKALEEEKIFLEAELNKAISVPEDAEEAEAEKQEEDLQPAEPVSADEEVEEEPS
ncbi:MAG: LapA family protein [Bacillota bacterium]